MQNFAVIFFDCARGGERRFELLDTHRIKAGGKYSYNNCVCLCNKCHRLHHTGIIKIIGWKNSSIGKILHYIDENNNEIFK